jgi:hypothetical protein
MHDLRADGSEQLLDMRDALNRVHLRRGIALVARSDFR